jgi:hypothetical protein
MKKGLFLVVFLIWASPLLAQSGTQSGGIKIFWLFLLLVPLAIFFLIDWVKPIRKEKKWWLLKRVKIQIKLDKDRLYYPYFLILTIHNYGKTDVDLERPLLIFQHWWIKRKFLIKGTNNYSIYPLYLEAGKTHTLRIDLGGFYGYDKKLKRFPKSCCF